MLRIGRSAPVLVEAAGGGNEATTVDRVTVAGQDAAFFLVISDASAWDYLRITR